MLLDFGKNLCILQECCDPHLTLFCRTSWVLSVIVFPIKLNHISLYVLLKTTTYLFPVENAHTQTAMSTVKLSTLTWTSATACNLISNITSVSNSTYTGIRQLNPVYTLDVGGTIRTSSNVMAYGDISGDAMTCTSLNTGNGNVTAGAGAVSCGTLTTSGNATVSGVIRTTSNTNNKKLVLYDGPSADGNVATAEDFYGFGVNTFSMRYQVVDNASHNWYTGATSTMSLSASGGLTCKNNITAYSDERLKDDIVRIEDSLAKINQLGGYTYTRNDLAGDSNIRYAGVLAQEVKKVLPEAVQENEDGYMSVSYGSMVALLVEGNKELSAKCVDQGKTIVDQGKFIIDLSQRLAALESNK
jgi:hypothetical protein